MIPTTSLPVGTLASDLDFSDDLDGLNDRIAFHEGRLKLARSEPVEDVAQANLLLFALAASRSPGEVEEQVRARAGLWYDVTPQAATPPAPVATTPPPAASTPPAPVPPPLAPPTTSVRSVFPATGYQRIAQAYAAQQPTTQIPAAVPSNGNLTGTLRLAAYYSQQPKTTPAA